MANNIDFTWLKIADDDVRSLYTWVKYADDAQGTNLSDDPTANSTYIGLAFNKEKKQEDDQTESSKATNYKFSKIVAKDGKDGADGKCVEIKGTVANEAGLTGLNTAKTGEGYITKDKGELHILTGSDYSKSSDWYKVGKIKGEKGDKGDQGIRGNNGKDAEPNFTWLAFSANSDGTGFTQTPQPDSKYLGIAVNKKMAQS